VNDLPGTFNLAGDGVLTLSQAIRRLGRPAFRLPSFTAAGTAAVVRRARLADFSPDQITFLTYGRAVDTTRMRAEFGFEPEYTTAAAFDDFRRSLRPGAMSSASQLLSAGLGALRG
jgi:UDP-glucose 4-epimerase